MKRIIAAVAAAVLLAGVGAPAFAQDRHDDRGYHNDRQGRDYYRDQHAAHVQAYRDHFLYRGRVWHDGDRWYGHPVHYYHGGWGYWAPRNGTNVFFRINL